MKHPGIALLLTAVILLTGCSSLVSINSFGEPSEIDPALAGTWKRNDEIFVLHPGDATYTILYTGASDSGAVRLEGRLLKTAEFEVLELTSAAAPDPFQIPAHLWVRVWPEESVLRWAYLDSAWLKEKARQHLTTQVLGEAFTKRMLLAAPEADVRSFLLRHAADRRAFGDIRVMQRVQ